MDKTIALYMRLSDEDDNLAAHEESNSISHQRKLMLDHIQKLPELKGCNILEFADDGYSGADFNRPNFVKMMDLVKAGKIQIIVTKDYSRLGRDYLEVGNYMECIFPVLQVRYISVNDNYDSANSFGSTGGMSVALKNLVNALYCKDASKKVRAAKAVLAKQGKYIASFAPFGYKKSEDDKHVLAPDPVTAPVVQLIFELAIKGMKYTEIANYLNQVSEGRLSSESKLQIRAMLREVTEIESIGDSCYNLARTINRKRQTNQDFTEKQYEHIHFMMKLTDDALEQMIVVVEHPEHAGADVNKSFNLENEINNYRNQLKNQNILDVNNKEYDYQMGVHYMDIITECEKLGDYVVNVVEAGSNVKEKKA